jgi:hypothetical protein
VLLRLRAALPWAYGLGLVWLNAYLVRHVFALTFTGATHSMHGYWMALGRVMGDSWLIPRWVPYWAGGMPAELTYAPLVPWLGWHFGMYAVMAGIFAIGPAALYLMAWQLSGKPGWSFVAGVAYSLLSPLQPSRILEPHRMYLTLVWDEAPHQLALSMVCLGVAAWARGWRRTAVLAIALAALANPFGVTGAVLFGLCWVLTVGDWKTVLFSGVLGYLVVSPFYPPSMLGVLRSNGELAEESVWTSGSWVGLLVVVAGLALLWRFTRNWAPVRRFAVLLVWVAAALPVLFYRWKIVLLQQPGRYQSEAELALVLFVVFAAERVLAARPRWLLAGLAVLGIVVASQQIVRHRKFSRNSFRQVPAEQTIEYRAAQNAKGTVFTAGSLAHWMNAFGDVKQYSGGSYATSPNTVQQRLTLDLTGQPSWEKFVVWMQAVGVDGVLIPGRQSPEFWKPFAKDVLAGHLPVVWEERDTRLYQVPRVRRTMVHSVPGMIPLEPYVAAIEDPAAPALRMEWLSANRGFVRGTWRPGDMVLVQMNWHKGWKAYLNGAPVPTGADGLGQMAVAPGGMGELELVYGGGWEGWGTRVASALALLTLALFRDRWRKFLL